MDGEVGREDWTPFCISLIIGHRLQQAVQEEVVDCVASGTHHGQRVGNLPRLEII